MKRKIIAALIATLAITQVGIGFTGNMGKVHAMNPNQYTDVVSTNVNYSYIEKMVDKGILDADTDTEFGTEKAMTRQGLLTALYRMEKNPLVLGGENTFMHRRLFRCRSTHRRSAMLSDREERRSMRSSSRLA